MTNRNTHTDEKSKGSKVPKPSTDNVDANAQLNIEFQFSNSSEAPEPQLPFKARNLEGFHHDAESVANNPDSRSVSPERDGTSGGHPDDYHGSSSTGQQGGAHSDQAFEHIGEHCSLPAAAQEKQ